jgi:uncharacterized protein YkwD
MGTLRRPAAPTRLGAWGITAVLALGGLNPLGASGSGASAGATARRLQPPAAAPAVDAPIARVIELTNQARAGAGIAPVTENAQADAAAGNHSADQAAHATMSHTGTNGSTCGQRLSAAGVTWRTWGENVAAGQRSADEVVVAWLNSPGHRTNMLNPAFRGIGIGVAPSADGTLYWTMDLFG